MSNSETLMFYQPMSGQTNELACRKLSESVPIQTYSKFDETLVQVVEDRKGHRVVARSFTDDNVAAVEKQSGLSFRDAWTDAQDVFPDTAIPRVPRMLVETDGRFPYVAVSKHVGDNVPLMRAPLLAKENLAHELGNMLRTSRDKLQVPKVLDCSMFRVTGQGSGAEIVLVDTDPSAVAYPIDDKSATTADRILMIGSLLHDEACTDYDRKPVMAAFVCSVGNVVLEDRNGDPDTFTNFTLVHLMSQGIDMRKQFQK